ncbi:MAG: alpha/beta hydrolase fold domain-containing protein [Gammaproteobacteria bacterium]|nr:alpha/beta hydrolase fold domain-containing protein [Gammaproteobacteria bacterium]
MNMRSKELFGSDGPDMETDDLRITGASGPIDARLYRPADGTLALIIYYHGGGWVIGNIASHHGLCARLAAASGAAVLSVEYRLAPEHLFPAAVEDCYAALLWAAEHGAEHGLDTARIAVAGDSAGGNLAAVAALMAREQDGPAIAYQALLYPATDMHMETQSHKTFTQHLLTPQSIRWFQNHYLPTAAARDDWRASPLRAGNLYGLPSAYVMTAGFDPLRDEGAAYAKALERADVDVTYQCFPGQIHGFLTLDKVIPQALEAIDDAAANIAKAIDSDALGA